jgi:MerR family transcriptional regulator/heat shock protein HspR
VTSQRRTYHMISWVAERYDIHPQTLRLYEREGLIQPTRSVGNTRLFDEATCERLQFILSLTRDLGVNLAGVEVILNLRDQIDRLQLEIERLAALVARDSARRGMVPREHALALRERGVLVACEEE